MASDSPSVVTISSEYVIRLATLKIEFHLFKIDIELVLKIS